MWFSGSSAPGEVVYTDIHASSLGTFQTLYVQITQPSPKTICCTNNSTFPPNHWLYRMYR
ncbi:mCG147965 [Mus musculus]|nr:mCG147965 [Mus musculus]